MKPNRLIILRHGQSQSNIDLSILQEKPDYACQLTELGTQQAIDAGLKLKEIIGEESVQFYVSPYWRTRETYRGVISESNLNIKGVREDPRIREQEWQSRILSDLVSCEEERDHYSTFYYRIANGESGADCYDRGMSFLSWMEKDFERTDFPDNVIIVSHGQFNRILLMCFLDLSVEEFEVLANPKNCEFYILPLTEKGDYALVGEAARHPASRSKFIYPTISK